MSHKSLSSLYLALDPILSTQKKAGRMEGRKEDRGCIWEDGCIGSGEGGREGHRRVRGWVGGWVGFGVRCRSSSFP